MSIKLISTSLLLLCGVVFCSYAFYKVLYKPEIDISGRFPEGSHISNIQCGVAVCTLPEYFRFPQSLAVNSFTAVGAERLGITNIRLQPKDDTGSFTGTLSPDGQWLLFWEFDTNIAVSRVSNPNKRKVLRASGKHPDNVLFSSLAWSPNSKHVFYSVRYDDYASRKLRRWVEYASVETGQIVRFPEDNILSYSSVESFVIEQNPSDPIIFLKNGEQIYATTKDGTKQWTVSGISTPNNKTIPIFISLSPDKTKILVWNGEFDDLEGHSQPIPHPQSIEVHAVDGSGVIARLGVIDPYFPGRTADTPDWSPDGTKILFSSPYSGLHIHDAGDAVADEHTHTLTPAGVYVVNADGTGRTLLIDDPNLLCRRVRWTPDGAGVVFGDRGGKETYLADLFVKQSKP